MSKEEFTSRLLHLQKVRKRSRAGTDEKQNENDYKAYHVDRIISTQRRYGRRGYGNGKR